MQIEELKTIAAHEREMQSAARRASMCAPPPVASRCKAMRSESVDGSRRGARIWAAKVARSARWAVWVCAGPDRWSAWSRKDHCTGACSRRMPATSSTHWKGRRWSGFASMNRLLFSRASTASCSRIRAASIRTGWKITSRPDGYLALSTVLSEMSPAEVIAEVTEERTARPRRRGLSNRLEVEHGRKGRRAHPRWWSATPMRAIRARSWIAACWKAIRTGCWKEWRSRPTRWALGRIHLRSRRVSTGSGAAENGHSPGGTRRPARATISPAASSASGSRSGWARALLCAARRRR